jgi:transposase
VDQEQNKLNSEITQLCKREFFCEADAQAEIKIFLKVHSHLMSDVDLSVISEDILKRPRGRPGKNAKPPQKTTVWKIVSLGLRRKEDVIAREIENASTFCLLTNISPIEKTSEDILLLYKGQGNVERQFTLLKEPLVAATIFLETPERIEALMTILYFSVLMHGILRVISHIELEKEDTPPKLGVEKRPLIRPTSDTVIWILDMYTAVSQKRSIRIESKDPERAKDLLLLLRLVRFDPAFL